MHALKSASYSVRGPVVVGACLASASADQIEALRSFAQPLGVAFQLRDDLLGLFGQPAETGKPSGNDLRRGKRTAVLVEAARMNAEVSSVLGRANATDEELRRAMAALEITGVQARVEARIGVLVEASRRALERAELTPRGRLLLKEAAQALSFRRS
jgi:geranylgeranyl diphosphate synthase type I